MAAGQTVEVGEPEEAVLVETDIRTEGGEEAERSLPEVSSEEVLFCFSSRCLMPIVVREVDIVPS